MTMRSRVSRRSFIATGAAVTASALTAPGAAAAEPDGPEVADDERIYTAIVRAVGPREELVLERDDGVIVSTVDPHRDLTGPFEPGHEALIIERYVDEDWIIWDVQRLFRAVDEELVLERDGDVLTTEAGQLEITSHSDSKADKEDGYLAVPLAAVGKGDIVTGLAYRDSTGERLVAAALGVREDSPSAQREQ